MKKIIGLGSGLVLLALSAVPAIAATNVSVSTTGPWSNTNVWVGASRKITVNNSQNAIVVNNVTSDVNTGNNSSMYNTQAGSTTTGNATSNLVVDNQLNGTVTQVNDCPCEGGDNQTVNVSFTGPFSTQNIGINARRTTTVDNVQAAGAENNIGSGVNTGNNSSMFNTEAGASHTTGHASSFHQITNWLNTSSTFINVPVGP